MRRYPSDAQLYFASNLPLVDVSVNCFYIRKHFPLRSTRRNPTGVGAVGAVDDVPTEASQRCMRQDVFPVSFFSLVIELSV